MRPARPTGILALAAILAPAFGRAQVRDNRAEHQGTTMDTSAPAARYRQYLRTFGITEPGDRVAEMSELDVGNVRFFAYASSDGLRLKAGVTPGGIVRPGEHAGDDWFGFLSGIPDAATVADRIAWLETDSSMPLHGLPGTPTIALAPDRPLIAGIDPAQWALITPPTLEKTAGGTLVLTAWFLPSGRHVPERRTITARAGAPAEVVSSPAVDLVSKNAGSPALAASAAAARARRLLQEGTENERFWALRHIEETADRGAVPEIEALLGNAGAEADSRLLAAGTLARFADPSSAGALGKALRQDGAPEVRRACAQALGRISGGRAVQALTQAAAAEPDAMVRLEIVRALASQGDIVRAVLARIAQDDHDPAVRKLALTSLGEI